jgi:solute carrier family 25 S-adenosylmethionine transporter 26
MIQHKRLGHQPHPWQAAACGALAGGFSAAVTTPLDVAKTRIMLAAAGTELAAKNSSAFALKVIFAERGFAGLFAGVVPRVMWITIGGGIFFGVYEQAKAWLS